ncbi:MAG TPA: MarR family transcriptional regulator, partial [Sphingomicrobium sp.]
ASSRGRPLLESPLTLPESDETSSERPGRMLALSEDDIESAVRLLRLITGEATASDPAAPLPVTPENRHLLLARARKIIRNRQLRSEYFHRAMFGEAAWDILLLLYVAEGARSSQTRATLSKSLATPPTTIQRWVDYLEKEHLVRRDPHPTDRRTAFVSLLDKGRNTLEHYLAAVAE